MKRLFSALLGVGVAALFLTACGGEQAVDSDNAIQAAVVRYLETRGGLDIASMDVVVEQVDYDGDSAQAAVTIQARADEKARMKMTYRLRQENGNWEVEPSESGAGDGAPSSAMPPGHSLPGGDAPPGCDLPSGHPPVGGEPPAETQDDLPAGHPPVAR